VISFRAGQLSPLRLTPARSAALYHIRLRRRLTSFSDTNMALPNRGAPALRIAGPPLLVFPSLSPKPVAGPQERLLPRLAPRPPFRFCHSQYLRARIFPPPLPPPYRLYRPFRPLRAVCAYPPPFPFPILLSPEFMATPAIVSGLIPFIAVADGSSFFFPPFFCPPGTIAAFPQPRFNAHGRAVFPSHQFRHTRVACFCACAFFPLMRPHATSPSSAKGLFLSVTS